MKKVILKYLILFLTGYSLYIAIEITFRGYSFVIMGICGGLAIIIIDKINDVISWDTDLLLQGLIGSFVITSFEFIIGEVFVANGLLPKMWDYSNVPLNFDGVICLPFSLIWVVLSIFAIFIADAINYYFFRMLPTPYYKIFGKTVIKFKG